MTKDSWSSDKGLDRTWDAGLAYSACQKRIQKAMERDKDSPSRVAKCLAYAIQLRNAARISEAVDALKEFSNGVAEPLIMIRKKPKFKSVWNRDSKRREYVLDSVGRKIKLEPEMRPMLWPEFLERSILSPIIVAEIQSLTKKQVQDSCRLITGVNSHTFRYARITRLADQGINPSLIAKITHHSSLDFILHYTQQKEADKLNREIK